jgi:hypothetical protein
VRGRASAERARSVLSAYEESSAACISDMLRQVSNGQYLEAIRMAEKFILHVEVLFAAIDDLEHHFARLQLKGTRARPRCTPLLTRLPTGMSHVREARMLCRKTVDLFTLLSHTNETGARRMGMTQELLALVTGLAHYLKILIRIALTGALRLEREHAVRDAVSGFLDKLQQLAVQGGNPGVPRALRSAGAVEPAPGGANAATQGVAYGFRSLAPESAGESPFWEAAREHGARAPPPPRPSDLCAKCGQTIEEDCVRLDTYRRWHSHCLACKACGRAGALPPPAKDREREQPADAPKLTTARKTPADVGAFVYEDGEPGAPAPTGIFCKDHAHPGCRGGFQAVSRLEQYAFLLNVALRRLYILLKNRGVVPLSPGGCRCCVARCVCTDPMQSQRRRRTSRRRWRRTCTGTRGTSCA